MFYCFSCFTDTCGYVYYERSIQVPKGVSNQTIYYNYIVMTNGLIDWVQTEFFFDVRRNLDVARQLIIPRGLGMLTSKKDCEQ